MKPLFALLSLALVFIAACGGTNRAPETQHATLGILAFDVPSSWSRQDRQTRQSISAEWRPSPNERKEALVITRTSVNPALIKAGAPAIEDLLRQAQRGLGKAKLTSTKSFTSSFGFFGVEIEADFVPPGLDGTYHRIHAVLLDGDDHLIHVIYTAEDADPDVVSILLSNLHREES